MSREKDEEKIDNDLCIKPQKDINLSDNDFQLEELIILKENYTSQYLFLNKINIDFINTQSFSYCIFPKLSTLIIRKAESKSFVHCEFPRIKTIQIENYSEATFISCHFPLDLKEKLNNNCYVNSTFRSDFISMQDDLRGEDSIKKEQNNSSKDLSNRQSIFFTHLLLASTTGLLLLSILKK